MRVVLSFSPTKNTLEISKYAAEYLNYPLIDLTSHINQKNFDYNKEYEYIVFCFPVYSQNIPKPVKIILKNLKAKYYILFLTYGKMHMGNALFDASILVDGIIIGGAYIPTKHTYKEGERFEDYQKLNSLLNRIDEKTINKIVLGKLPKNPLSNIFPNLRSRIGVKLKKNKNCINCNSCNKVCPTNSINNGIIRGDCLRCLSCYDNCKQAGLSLKFSLPLKLYLKKDKTKTLIIY